jgi:hypothetical protein
VTGRLIDQSTKLPLGNTKVALYTDDATTGHYSGKNSIQLDLKTTNDDGTFELNSMASRVGNYCIRSRNSLTNSYEFNTTSKKIDIGDVIAPK